VAWLPATPRGLTDAQKVVKVVVHFSSFSPIVASEVAIIPARTRNFIGLRPFLKPSTVRKGTTKHRQATCIMLHVH
jgi:hypothetical protein